MQLHNNLIHGSLDVRPELVSMDGTRIELPVIQIAALGNKSLDLRKSLQQAHGSSLNCGSAVFEYQHAGGGALLVENVITEPSETVAYTIPGTDLGASTADQHAVFWIPSTTTE